MLLRALVLLVWMLSARCSLLPRSAPTDLRPALLASVYFYRGFNIGAEAPSTGLQSSGDEGASWQNLGWRHLISSSVEVGADGRTVLLGAGNGVLVSRDAGTTFRLTGGTQVTEVQRVRLHPRDPLRAIAATPYGVFLCRDLRDPRWEALPASVELGFCNDALFDASQDERVLVASDRGIFQSEDGGSSFRSTDASVRVRRFAADASQPGRFLAASDGRGLLESTDHGARWRGVPGTEAVLFCVEPHPRQPRHWMIGGRNSVARSDDSGHRFAPPVRIAGSYDVYDVAWRTDDTDTVWISGTDGVMRSRDGGQNFEPIAFAGAVVPDLAFTRLATAGGEAIASDAPGVLPPFAPALGSGARDPTPGVDARRRELQAALVQSLPAAPGPLHAIAALAAAGSCSSELAAQLMERFELPSSSMFDALQAMALYLHGGGRLPEDLRTRLQELLTRVPVYRGDTENHWVMHYSVQLLAAQSWPATPAREWGQGKDTAQLYTEAVDWLREWALLTATEGQGEFDSPHYIQMFVSPLLLLHDFAADPSVRQLAGMTLDLILADYLTESLRGAYGGGHSRDTAVEQTRSNPASIYHFVFAGGIPLSADPPHWAVFPAYSKYQPPPEFARIANDRLVPYEHREKKRVRHVIRHGQERNPPVYKYTWMTGSFCMGSLPGGILQPIQQHTWDVTWNGSADNSLLFTLHPLVSSRELSMFFPEDPYLIVDSVEAQKGSYTSPDKLVSSSPYEQVFQCEDTLLAMYQVPPEVRFPHVQMYVPDCLTLEEAGSWRFGRDGEFFVAVHCKEAGRWIPHEGYRLLRLPGARTAIVTIAGSGSESDYQAFRAGILARAEPVLEELGDGLRLQMETPSGRVLTQRWGEPQGRVDGVPWHDFTEWLYRGPWLRSRRGSGVIELTDGRTRRRLDFRSGAISVQHGGEPEPEDEERG